MTPQKSISTKNKKEKTPKRLTPKQVLGYLEAHPAFLKTHAAQLQDVLPPKKLGNLFSLHAVRAGTVETKLQALKKRFAQVVDLARGNAAAQAEAHQALLPVIGAVDLPALRKALQGPFRATLRLQAARLLGLGATESATTLTAATLAELTPLQVQLGPFEPAQHAAIFGPSPTLRSVALLQLTDLSGLPIGLLALGSEDAGHFHAGQDTALLEFTRHVVALRYQAVRGT